MISGFGDRNHGASPQPTFGDRSNALRCPLRLNALLMAAQPLAVQVGVAPACQALGVSRATFYRRQRSTPGHQPRPTPARALCEAEREQVLVTAGIALDAQKPVLDQAALQVFVELLLDERSRPCDRVASLRDRGV